MNRRYLDALAEAKPSTQAVSQLDSLCRRHVLNGKPFARFNPVSRADSELFQAVLAGAYLVNGLSNRDLQNQLWCAPRDRSHPSSTPLSPRLAPDPKAPQPRPA